MDSTQRRMIAVAVAVCAFAVGMAGLLNYFKYRATTERLLEQRLATIGRSIANNIQSSLALGLQFADIGTLPAVMRRASDGDELITGIDVFDTGGLTLYSTAHARLAQPVPAAWRAAIARAGDLGWVAHGDAEPAVGIAVQNHFGLTVGHLALRYSPQVVARASRAVGRELAVAAVGVFAVTASLASLALVAVVRRLDRDVQTLEAALLAADPGRSPAASRRGPFRRMLRRFAATVRTAQTQIAEARSMMRRNPPRDGVST